MKQKRIRHIPVVENQKVVGMVSMRDLLDIQLDQTEAQIRYASLLPKRTQRRLV
jgi:CBS domain-containing protein